MSENKNTEQSAVSKIPWYYELANSAFLLTLFSHSFQKAWEFRKKVPGNGKAEFLAWTIGTWFAIRFTVFISAWIIGWRNTVRFRKELLERWTNGTVFQPEHVSYLIFLFKIDIKSLVICASSVIRAMGHYCVNGRTGTIVFLSTNLNMKEGERDIRVLQWIQKVLPKFPGVQIAIVPQKQGKRYAGMQGYELLEAATEFDSFAARCPKGKRGIVLQDGDSEVPMEDLRTFISNIFAPICPEKGIVATTVNNRAMVDEKSPFRIGDFLLRFMRRDFLMRAVPTVLTGRCSAFWGEIVDEEFQKAFMRDVINLKSWKRRPKIFTGEPLFVPFRLIGAITYFAFGPVVTFFTGTADDKSTIKEVLRRGYGIVYNPDTYVICHEDLKPAFKNLLDIYPIQVLGYWVRYMRNALNNLARLQLFGLKKLGGVRMFAVVSERYFFWTVVVGFISLPFIMKTVSWDYLHVYVSMIIFTRSMMTGIMCLATGNRWSSFYPELLYYTHTAGGFVKIWAWCDPVSKGFTRHATGKREIRFTSMLRFATVMAVLVTTIATMCSALGTTPLGVKEVWAILFV